MQINISDIWGKDTRAAHNTYVESILKLSTAASGSLLDQFMQKHRYHFALGKPKRLRAIIATAEGFRSKVTDIVFNDFLEKCKELFDYKSFSTKGIKGWNAYRLCASSRYQVCPYCQQAGALTIYRDPSTKSFRPTLDHYYPKADYPYLALSLYNLVPSCYTCNSSLKSTTDFYQLHHLHPYEDEELIRYDWDVDRYLYDRVNAGPIPGSLALTEVRIRSVSPTHKKRPAVMRSIETFLVEERLDFNLLSLRQFQETLLSYRGGRLKEVNDLILSKAGWPLTEGQALQFSYRDYKNEWYGRLKADLYDAAWYNK